jgi:Cu/Ag efflux pump CusA
MSNSKLKLSHRFVEYDENTLYFSNKKSFKEVVLRILSDLPDGAVNIELQPSHSSGITDVISYDIWVEK